MNNSAMKEGYNQPVERSEDRPAWRIREGVTSQDADGYEAELKTHFDKWIYWESLRGKSLAVVRVNDQDKSEQERLDGIQKEIAQNAERERTEYYRLSQRHIDFYVPTTPESRAGALSSLEREVRALSPKLDNEPR